jgi:dCMP deaminase
MKSSRPKKLMTHLKVAKVYAEESHARRLKVGAVLVRDDRVIATGYNGMPAGMSNKAEILKLEPGDPFPEWVTKSEVTHAEMNVIGYAATYGVATNDCVMVITHSPCFECAKLIKAAHVKAIYYETEYRLTESLDFLKELNIMVEKI